MSLPTIEPLPDENDNLPPARRRRQRRMIVPPEASEQAELLSELAYRTVPSFDFYLFSLLTGLTLGAGLLFNSPALVILAVLLAPFMAPIVGISLGTITGSMRFVLQSLGSLGTGSLIVFLSGALAGWAVHLLPAQVFQQAAYHTHFTWLDLLVVVVGSGLTTYLTVQSKNQRPLVASVAIAYGIYLPVGVAGFGLSSGIDGLWPAGLVLFFVHLVWSVLTGTLVFYFLGLRPLKTSGYLLGAVYAALGIASILFIYQPEYALPASINPAAGANALTPVGITAGKETQQPEAVLSPSPLAATVTSTITQTLMPSPTRSPVPSQTPTLTITPVPTPFFARVSAESGNGALIREDPNFDAPVIQSLLNGTLVEILVDIPSPSETNWVHVRIPNGKEGWMVRDLLRTATVEPTP